MVDAWHDLEAGTISRGLGEDVSAAVSEYSSRSPETRSRGKGPSGGDRAPAIVGSETRTSPVGETSGEARSAIAAPKE